MERRKDFPWELLPLGAVFLAVINMWGTIIMSFKNVENAIWIALIGAAASIGAAIITGTIALIGQWRQAKRDGKTIDGISSDTSGMKPKVEDIHTSVKTMVPDILKIEERNSKIDFIAGEIEYQKRLKEDLPKDDRNRDSVLAEIRAVYERNAALNAQLSEAQQRILMLTEENTRLRSQVSELEAELQEYEPEF